MITHRQKAVRHIEASKAAAAALQDAYAAPRHDRALIADLNADINRGLKIAEIEAVLAVADAIEANASAPAPRVGVTL